MLSHPKTARNGNIVASLGMLIAVIATVYLGTSLDFYKILIAMTIGSNASFSGSKMILLPIISDLLPYNQASKQSTSTSSGIC